TDAEAGGVIGGAVDAVATGELFEDLAHLDGGLLQVPLSVDGGNVRHDAGHSSESPFARDRVLPAVLGVAAARSCRSRVWWLHGDSRVARVAGQWPRGERGDK